MVGRPPFTPYTFRALKEVFGELYARCDVCRRYAVLYPTTDLAARDSRRTTFGCCVCGAEGASTVTRPDTEQGMEDYRRDNRDNPRRHPAEMRRFTSGTDQAWISHNVGADEA